MPKTANQMARQKLLHDLPLPGHYDCLTLQLNLTAYRSGMAGKLVVVTRMPSDQLEVNRTWSDPGPWAETAEQAVADVYGHMRIIEYLMGWPRAEGVASPPGY